MGRHSEQQQQQQHWQHTDQQQQLSCCGPDNNIRPGLRIFRLQPLSRQVGGVLLLYRERGGFIFRPLYLDRWGCFIIMLGAGRLYFQTPYPDRWGCFIIIRGAGMLYFLTPLFRQVGRGCYILRQVLYSEGRLYHRQGVPGLGKHQMSGWSGIRYLS